MRIEILIKRSPDDDCPFPMNQSVIYAWLAWLLRKCPYACEVKQIDP